MFEVEKRVRMNAIKVGLTAEFFEFLKKTHVEDLTTCLGNTTVFCLNDRLHVQEGDYIVYEKKISKPGLSDLGVFTEEEFVKQFTRLEEVISEIEDDISFFTSITERKDKKPVMDSCISKKDEIEPVCSCGHYISECIC